MRLPLEAGLRPIQKLMLRGFKWAMKGDAPGPLIVGSYNKRFFGSSWARCMQQGMRRATEWQQGELELFAASISKANSCNY